MGISGVESGALPVPIPPKLRTDTPTCHNNNYVDGERSPKRSPKRKTHSKEDEEMKKESGDIHTQNLVEVMNPLTLHSNAIYTINSQFHSGQFEWIKGSGYSHTTSSCLQYEVDEDEIDFS